MGGKLTDDLDSVVVFFFPFGLYSWCWVIGNIRGFSHVDVYIYVSVFKNLAFMKHRVWIINKAWVSRWAA